MNRTVLMVKVGTATFIERDEAILASAFRLKVFRFGLRGLSFVSGIPRFIIWVLRNIWTADLLFTRFAHYHAFLLALAGRLSRRPTVIVVGGSDAIWIPRYGYGVYHRWLSRRTTPWALRMASMVLPNHASLVQGVNRWSDDSPRPEGLHEYIPDLRTPIRVVHNGYDPDFWKPVPGIARLEQVLSVSPATDRTVFLTKGLDDFLRTAALLPEVPFVLVGVARPDAEAWLDRPAPPNVRFEPLQGPEALRALYCRSKVFAHFTLTEGMPNVLCEAMLCECIPVGTPVNSLPEIIGDTGVLLTERNPEAMKTGVLTALRMRTGSEARKRIADRYPAERRRTELLAALNDVITSKA